MKRWLLVVTMMMTSLSLYASEDVLHQTLVRVINQLNALMPLLDEAQAAIEPHQRIQLHIDTFEGADGQLHPGLRQDILSIRHALMAYLNKPVIEAKTIQPLALDFVGEPS